MGARGNGRIYEGTSLSPLPPLPLLRLVLVLSPLFLPASPFTYTRTPSTTLLQLYAMQYGAALLTAIRVAEYDDIIDPVQAHSLLALAASSSHAYETCSKVRIVLASGCVRCY